MRAPTILALGGHELDHSPASRATAALVLRLAGQARRAGRAKPRICLLPTASGDPDRQIAAFGDLYSVLGAEVSHVSLFRLEQEGTAVRDHLLAQDAIYVGGGSMVNLLAIWRAHGVDAVLAEAWRRGVVIAGQSAGAMCWFELGVSRSTGQAILVDGLGLVEGSLCAHYHRDPDRRAMLIGAVRGGAPAGWGLDDGAGILVEGRRVRRSVSATAGAWAWRVQRGGTEVTERRLGHRRLDPPGPEPHPDHDEGISELRLTLGSRAGVGPPGLSSSGSVRRRWG